MRRHVIGGLAALGMVLAATAANAEMMTMKAALASSSEVPPNPSTASGTITATFDSASRQLTWEGSYTGLSGPATMAHFHGPAEPGKNAPVMVPSPAASPIKGSATLTEAQAADLTAGKLYFNVHTAAHPGGEIRGQVAK